VWRLDSRENRPHIVRILTTASTVTQFSLFSQGPLVLLDDASGRIVYEENVISADDAADWYTQLLDSPIWRQQRRMMYERELDVPRLTAHFAADDPALPSPLNLALQKIRDKTGQRFNSIGLNLYRDEHDSVAMHNDRLDDLVEGQPIALLSLGETRRMHIRSKKHVAARRMDLDLVAGSLLMMSWHTQHHYDHGIPKQNHPLGPRISVAFRTRTTA
jgi:alkylated DNA repair dioxygenase AlkB